MYLLKLYDWNCWPSISDIRLYRSLENAKVAASEYARKFVYQEMLASEYPDTYGCKDWEEFISKAIDWQKLDEVFTIDFIQIED